MAEEDLIFGKHRHFFGGIEPSNMIQFSGITRNAHAQITAELPNDTVINGQTLCTVAGAVIRRKTTGFPKDEFDGDLVANITESSTFIDEGSSPGNYYYSAFPYTAQGVYNRNKMNRFTIKVRAYGYLFGYDLVKSTSNPATRISYPSDVDNATFSAMGMNFGNDTFNYGDWANVEFMPKPCMLNYNGTVAYYLNPNDYTKKIDGTNSDIANVNFTGNAMMEWPKIYTKRWEENGVYHFRCSDTKIDADYECWCNYDKNNNEIDHFYTPIYFGSKDSSNRLRSISDVINSRSTTADSEINYAKANGNDWYTEVLADYLLINDLLVMMGKTTDCQTVYGTGRCASNNTDPINTGTMNDKGLFWGSNNKTSGVKVFGMENYWGNMWRRIAGWMLVNNTQKVKLTRGTKDGSTATDYNTTASGYISITGSNISGNSGGYIDSMQTTIYGRLPIAASGSASTYECDGLWYATSGSLYAYVGGHWGNDLLVGPFFALLDVAASGTRTGIGAAISCKPLA